jgi:hypothetical protein
MKIIMSKTMDGSVDGIRVSTYMAGTAYDLTATEGSRELARAFVGAGWADEEGAPAPKPAESTAATVAPDAAEQPAAPKPGRKPKAQ